MTASLRGRSALWLGAILLVGTVARVPGVFWGGNFPFGWWGHHVDEYTHLVNAEMLINPAAEPRWTPNPYPRGLAAHVAPPFVALRAVQGRLFDPMPSSQAIVTSGRLVSVAYGVATIVLVFLVSRLTFSDPRVAHAAALIFSLTGLHVTQSHFFLADVPFLFWCTLASYLTMLGFLGRGESDDRLIVAAAASVGAAIGIKLAGVALASLMLLVLWRPPRLYRLVLAGGFILVGFVLVNLNAFPLKEIAKTVAGTGVGHIKSFSRVQGVIIYLIQLPALVSAPVVALTALGLYWGVRAWRSCTDAARKRAVQVGLLLPAVLWSVVVLVWANNFPRHLLPFTPLIAMAAGYGLVRLSDAAQRRGVPAFVPGLLLVGYLGAFVVDGERVFFQEPRNQVAQWLREHVPSGTAIWWQGHGGAGGYEQVVFPAVGRPPVLVVELHRANSYLSGMSWKNSMPTRLADVHGITSEEELQVFQSVFRGTTEYREVARFTEGYVMPEFRLVDGWLGNRARNYVAEIVVFQK